jgi:hypothetical protein
MAVADANYETQRGRRAPVKSDKNDNVTTEPHKKENKLILNNCNRPRHALQLAMPFEAENMCCLRQSGNDLGLRNQF